MHSGRFRGLLVVSISLFGLVSCAWGAGNLLLNPGAEQGSGVLAGSTATDWVAGGESHPGRDNGTFDHLPVHSGGFDFYGGTGASGTLTQQVNLVSSGFGVSQLDSGTLRANVGFWEMSLNQGDPSDAAGVTLTFRDVGGGTLGTAAIPPVYFKEVWRNVVKSVALPVGTRLIDYTMTFKRNVGSDLDSFIDDNSLTLAECFPGDTNMDNKVNFTDLLTLAQHYGLTSGQSCATGDFTDDGAVTFDDLLILAQHYGQNANALAAVPEPTGAILTVPLGLLLRRRR